MLGAYPQVPNFCILEAKATLGLAWDLGLPWFFDLNGRKDAKYLAFIFSRHKYPIYSSCIKGAKALQPITKITFSMVMNNFKEECEGAT